MISDGLILYAKLFHTDGKRPNRHSGAGIPARPVCTAAACHFFMHSTIYGLQPAALLSSFFDLALSAIRIGTPLDFHTHFAHIGQNTRFHHTHAHP